MHRNSFLSVKWASFRRASASCHRLAITGAAVAIATILLSGILHADEPSPLKKIYGQDSVEAGKLRDRADMLRELCERLLPRSTPTPVSLDDESLRKSVDEVVAAYNMVIDQYAHTEIASYCAMRLSGFYSRLGDREKAAELLEETAKEYEGTEEWIKLIFEAGLLEAQGRNNQLKAIELLELIPKPEMETVESKDRSTIHRHHLSIKYYVSAQQQLTKCELILGRREAAATRMEAAKELLPTSAKELDRFYKFEILAQKSNPADKNVAPPAGEIRRAPDNQSNLKANDKGSIEADVDRLAPLRPGPEMDRAIAQLAIKKDEAVHEIARQIVVKGKDFGWVHQSVRVLKDVNSVESRDLLKRIALSEFEVANSNLESWAARSLIACDAKAARSLLSSTNSDILTASLNALDGNPVDRELMAPLLKCLQSNDFLVECRAAEVMATAPAGELAAEALDAIEHALVLVAEKPNLDALRDDRKHFDADDTLGERYYQHFIGAFAKLEVDDSVLRQVSQRLEGRAKDTLVLALARRKDVSVHDEVVRILKDPSVGMFRTWAAWSFEQVGSASDIQLLTSVASKDELQRRGQSSPVDTEDGKYYPVRDAAARSIKILEHQK